MYNKKKENWLTAMKIVSSACTVWGGESKRGFKCCCIKRRLKTLFYYHPSKLLLVIIFYLSIHNSVLLTLKTISKTPSYMYENPIGGRFMYLLQFILIAVCFLCIIFIYFPFFCFCFRKSCKTSECSFLFFCFLFL